MELSVVIPVYGCGDCLRTLHARLRSTLDTLVDDYEIIFVDDRSPDDAWELISELSRADEHVRGCQLSRNYGQHAAITAGLQMSTGRRVVVMDCDLQDPPEEIRRLHAKATEGYDVVLGRRRTRRDPLHRRILARVYFGLLNRFAKLDIDGAQGSFSLLSRKVVDGFLRFRDRDRHYLLIVRWLGFQTAVVEYEPSERAVGRSSYTIRRLLRHALDGVFFQTTVLLRWVVYLGFLLSFAGALCAAYLVFAKLTGSVAPGWTSLAVFTLIIGGFIITSTGITGLYVGKVFEQVKGRPLYVLDRTIHDGVEDPAPEARSPSSLSK